MQDVDDLNIFWAKSVDEGESYLPLLQHAQDVTDIIEHVAHQLVAPGRLDRLQNNLGGMELSKVLKAAAWFHDCGKISLFFQPKVCVLYGRVAQHGYRGSVTPKQMSANPHSVVGAHAVAAWLRARAVNANRRAMRRAIRGWKYVIGGHHGVFPVLEESAAFQLEPLNWQEARERFLDYGMELIGLDGDDITDLATLPWDAADQALITGILIAADWVGSNEQYFPYEAVDPENRLDEALDRLDLGGVWLPSGDIADHFAERFNLPAGSEMRSVQKAGINIALRQRQPFFALVEDETGGGKTETALAMAEIMAAKFDLDGLFFAQPTRVTSDAMFSRVAHWLRSGVSGDAPISTILAHGKAEFSEEFRSLASGRIQAVYDDEGSGEVALEATQWFRGRKTNLLASVVVGTIDQLLFAALKSKHVVLRHLGLAGKVVIIDEIHAADTYMRQYLTRVLEWLGYYQVPVIALSATLPPEQRKQLVTAYYDGATKFGGSNIEPDPGNGYPRITVTSSAGVETGYPVPDGRRIRHTHVEFLEGDLEELADAVLSEAEGGGCIAVICSTINRAQQLYELLGGVEDEEVELLHSRFLTDHRFEKETSLVSKLGKDGTQRPQRLIVVSTQIIEQGLDLDFDLMFSDIAPLDLLIQRMGRLHRHQHLDVLRPKSMKELRLVVIGVGQPNEQDNAPRIPRGLVAVYRAAPLLRSALVLKRHLDAHGGVVTAPDHVAPLVADAYDHLLSPPDAWKQKWEAAEQKDQEFHADQLIRANQFRIPSAYDDALEKWSAVLTPADEQQGAAQVRDSDDSYEVVVAMRLGDGLYALPRVTELEGQRLDGVMELDWPVARTLAKCTVRLPGWLMTDSTLAELEEDGQESWQKSPWLKGQLPLVLDENLQRVLNGQLLTYDEDYGLLIEKYDEEQEEQQENV